MSTRYKIPRFTLKLVRDNRGGSPIQMTAYTAAKILQDCTKDLPYEEIWMLTVDAQSRIISSIKIAQGGAHGCGVLVSDILRPAIVSGCSGFILGHNHPSGDHTPSKEDIELTQQVVKASGVVCCPLLDHIVVSENGYTSMFEQGIL